MSVFAEHAGHEYAGTTDKASSWQVCTLAFDILSFLQSAHDPRMHTVVLFVWFCLCCSQSLLVHSQAPPSHYQDTQDSWDWFRRWDYEMRMPPFYPALSSSAHTDQYWQVKVDGPQYQDTSQVPPDQVQYLGQATFSKYPSDDILGIRTENGCKVFSFALRGERPNVDTASDGLLARLRLALNDPSIAAATLTPLTWGGEEWPSRKRHLL